MFHSNLIEPKNNNDVRAARNYLNWTQPELAIKAGCNITTIHTLEKGNRITKKNIINKVTEVFAKEGIKFHLNGGFSIDKDTINFFEGKDCYLKLQDDILKTCQKEKETVFYLGADDKQSSKEIIEKEKEIYKAGISCKNLISLNNNYILGSLEDYRQIDSKYFVPIDLTIIYDTKVAFDIHDKNNNQTIKIICINDSVLANKMKEYFLGLWQIAKKPIKSSTEQILFK